MKIIWQKAWTNPTFRYFLFIIIGFWLVLLSQLSSFFAFIQNRKGIVIQDFILTSLPSYNLSVPIFLLLYGLTFLFFIRLLRQPALLLQFLWAYFIIMLLRILCLYIVPLEPPLGLVNLVDPLSKYFYGGVIITKDLFFSGHTATCLLIYFLLPKPLDKIIALTTSILVIIMLLVQHIHYSIDILAAIIITFGVAYFVKKRIVY